MKELSVFVDESGDWGEYDYRSPYYIVSFIFHDQNINIENHLEILENKLSNLGFSHHCVHVGPIIRGEEEYRYVDIQIRQKITKSLLSFVRNLDIKVECFYIEKKHISDSVDAAGKLGRLISRFIRDNYHYFLAFDSVKVYYDNGQIELSRILSTVFNTMLDNVIFKRVLPKDYRLFQAADLACTLKLTELKMMNHSLSKSETNFFQDERTIKKNYIKVLRAKSFYEEI